MWFGSSTRTLDSGAARRSAWQWAMAKINTGCLMIRRQHNIIASMNYRSIIAARSVNARLLPAAAGRQGQLHMSMPNVAAVGDGTTPFLVEHEHYRHDSATTIRRYNRFVRCRFQSSVASPSSSSHSTYVKPRNVELWEELASKELSKSTMTVESLRTERVTPVRRIGLTYAFFGMLFVSCVAVKKLRSSHLIFYLAHLCIAGGHCHSACLLRSRGCESLHASEIAYYYRSIYLYILSKYC